MMDWKVFGREMYWSGRNNALYSRDCCWPAQRGWSPLTLATTAGGKLIHHVKNTSLYHCLM